MGTTPTHVADLAAAMDRALTLAARGPAHGPNPRVGCVLLAPQRPGDVARRVIGEGWHRGAGTDHAEVAALADARERGNDPRAATAVVTLEPCDHTGRTGPCARALLDAAVAEVVYALDDPGQASGGGAQTLRAHGVLVSGGLRAAASLDLVRAWRHALRAARPYVTLKLATTLDGRVAAPDGTSRWITGPAARAHAHAVRATVDAIAVTTGTALADDPALTARTPDGALAGHQPLRVVVGHRDLPPGARLHGPGGQVVRLRTHDAATVLAALHEREVRHLLVEGGPALATALLAAGVVDEVHAYLAPVLLGAGPSAVAPFGVTTLSGAPRWRTVSVQRLGDDALLVARAEPTEPVDPTEPAHVSEPAHPTDPAHTTGKEH
ncbi:bifunctional diaminohydroxyphosphoribosylaminopyrimidine deaminase/5-amino-6-(5-phosphoribosylamino)uracil reductase RibD [Xylanimonas ulmi]|uniref:Riboflavin biosynthesis protein RibD n=1 Tax=Xylanimonas ulmi TaxID=228973 RepID=A0A4Q7M116_9MICO|nr:bifunctional diaminohydroxyphosphoribosylaminopyrimidine deaminase/5-amino-6-(5-phosphoribosylamino)uracil reductase RibD [Xylanibacterium ulmi]RZS60901.1 diaminohydroxyphosphoribosylaminopyrimidine deaminase/5-amino-6-(5-phosphoribosylamino)uracil reductase [Xylanibacterium ulmi]